MTRPPSSTTPARITYAELAERVNRCANALRVVGARARAARAAVHARHDRLAGRLPRRDQGRRRPGGGQHAAHRAATTRYMLEDSRRARPCSSPRALLPTFAPLLRRPAASAAVVVAGGEAAATCRSQRSSARGTERSPRADDHRRRRLLLALFLGLDRAAQGHGARCTRSLVTDRRALRAAGARHPRGATSCSPRPSSSSPTGWATRLTFPLRGRRHHRADGRAADARGGRSSGCVEQRPTIFYGVPTLYAAMLASRRAAEARAARAAPLRLGRRGAARRASASAGREHFGVEILDGIGSTEMLHIFLSNRPGDVRYGTTGKPVPGYELRSSDEQGAAGTRRARSATCRSAARRRRSATGTTARRAARPSRGRGRAAATSTPSTPTATTSTPAAATTC